MNRIKATFLTLFISLASLTGCASNGDGSQAAGLKQPEVLINAPQERVKAVITERLVRAGYQFESEGSNSMVYSIPITDLGQSMSLVLMGVSGDAKKESLVEYTILPNGDKTTLIGRHYVRVSNAFGQSKKILMSDKNPSNQSLVESMERVKNQAENKA